MRRLPYILISTIAHAAAGLVVYTASVLSGSPDPSPRLNLHAGSSTRVSVALRTPSAPAEFVELEVPLPRLPVHDPDPSASEFREEKAAEIVVEPLIAAAPRPEPTLDRPMSANRIPVPPDLSDPGTAELEVAPVEVSTPPPAYPRLARRRGLEGFVVIEYAIGVDGACTDVAVGESSGIDLFDEAALEAVRSWRFQPARRRSVPVVSRHRIRFTFRMEDRS